MFCKHDMFYKLYGKVMRRFLSFNVFVDACNGCELRLRIEYGDFILQKIIKKFVAILWAIQNFSIQKKKANFGVFDFSTFSITLNKLNFFDLLFYLRFEKLGFIKLHLCLIVV